MDNDPRSSKMTAKELAKQVFPLVKQFLKDQVAARKNYPRQQPGTVGGFLRPQNQNQNYYPSGSNQTAYQQQPYGQTYLNQNSQGREEEIRDCLEAHNEARRRAPGPRRRDLQWDKRLALHAQRWAEHLALIDKFEHDRSGTGEGENLYMYSGPGRQSFRHAVDTWNGERVFYHGQKIGQGDLSRYGHYTQNIWPTTTHVGMARATGRDGKQITVARYSPPGNIIGRSAHE